MATDPSVLTGLFREVYADDLRNLIPDASKLTRMIPFVSRDKQPGNYYHQPVVVAQEHGVTYASATDGAFALNTAVSMATQDAQVRGSQMLLRASLSYDAATKASNSKKAFREATELLVSNMMESITKRLEIALLYGGTLVNGSAGLGTFTAATGTADSATQETITCSAGTFAAGIWAGLKNAKVNFYYNSAGTYTLISSAADSVFVVAGIDTDTRKITFTGTATGCTALHSRDGTDDVVAFFNGAFNKEMNGINRILVNTGSLFNIDASTYDLWKSNVSTVSSGAMTMGKLLQGIAKAVNRGLNEDVVGLVNPDTWQNLNNDLAALRMIDQSFSTAKTDAGTQSISFYGQNGKVELIPYNIVKAADCFVFPKNRVKRIGSQDVSFQTPGRGDEIFLHLPDNAGFELRCYTDQAVFIEEPALCVKITGFVNS